MSEPRPTFRIASDVGDDVAGDLASAFEAFGWDRGAGDGCALVWTSGRVDPDPWPGSGPARLVNRIPGTDILANKDELAAALDTADARAARRGVRRVPIMPPTFSMPGDDERLRAAAASAPNKRWVQRSKAAVADFWGFGLERVDEAERGEQWVVQEEVVALEDDGPTGIARVHVLVRSIEPLLAYVLAPRTASSPSTPAPIQRLVARLLASVREPLLAAAASVTGGASGCFQLLGLDLAVDRRLRPWVFEVDLDPLSSASAELRRALARDVAALCRPGRDPAAETDIAAPAFPSRETADEWAYLALPRDADLELAERCGMPRPVNAPLAPHPGAWVWPVGSGLGLYVPEMPELVVLTTAGAYVWTAMTDGLDAGAIAAELVEASGAEPGQARAQVLGFVGDLADRGALVPRDTAASGAAPDRAVRREALAVPYLRWNQDRVYECAARRVSVRVPNDRVGGWVDVALGGAAAIDGSVPTTIDAFVEVQRANDGWCVSGTHFAAAWCPADHQLPALVRDCVLLSAVRTSDAAVLTGSALTHDGRTAIVLGENDHRVDLVASWVGAGRCWVADGIVAVTADGRAVLPARVGMTRFAAAQWVNGEPGPVGSSCLSAAGALVRFWFPAPTAGAAADLRASSPADELVLLLNREAGPTRTDVDAETALRALLAYRAAPHDGVTEREAASLAMLAADVTCHEIWGAAPAAADLLADLLAGSPPRESRRPDPKTAPAAERA